MGPSSGNDPSLEAGDPISAVLSIARATLGMEIAFVAEFEADDEILRWVDGDTDTFELREGDRIPLGDSYCDRLVRGDIEALVPDVKSHALLGELPATTDLDVGSYVGVPIRFSDGRTYGTLCCLSHEERPDLVRKDLGVVEVLATMVSGELERRSLLRRKMDQELEAAGAEALLAALDARDGYTAEHSDAVVILAEGVARHLRLSDEDVRATHQVALLHDIGKIGIPDQVLRKPGALDEREWALMREHPIIGARIIGSISGLRHLAGAIQAEHERWDGTGYPDGLAGQKIPLFSRIVFVCDAYHAMMSDRPYRKAMAETKALAELRDGSGTQFDPAVVDALLTVRGADRSVTPDRRAETMRVVLVDDDANTRLLLRFTLEAEGDLQIIGEARDGAEAVGLVKSEQPDAVVLDLAMPVLGGLDALPEIKRSSPESKIVVFSAADAPDALEKATVLGADVCIGKGESLSAVGEALQELLVPRREAAQRP